MTEFFWNYNFFFESNVTNLFKRFHENGLMANSRLSHFLISPYDAKSIEIQNLCIKAISSEELLLIKSDSSLTFHDHITSLCSKANKKYIGIKKRRMLMKSYISSQFNYCLLVWMWHSRSLNNKINQIQEIALQIV